MRGIWAAYSGTWPETYAIYPPVLLYAFRAVGALYRAAVDPAFDLAAALDSQPLTWFLRQIGIVAHFALGTAVWALARPRVGPRRAWLTLLAYLFNPAALFDIAYWGQPDPVHSLLVMLTLVALAAGPAASAPLDLGRRNLVLGAAGGVLAALAMLTKPQAWLLAPLCPLLALWRRGAAGTALAALAGGATAFVVCLPYLRNGTLRQLLTLPEVVGRVGEAVSAYTHNFWWLATWGRGMELADVWGIVGDVQYRPVGLALVGLAYLWAVACLARAPRTPQTALLTGAFIAFAFTMLATRIHANHPFYALALLAPLLYEARPIRYLYAGLSATLLVNVAWHDIYVAWWLRTRVDPTVIFWVPLVNSALNLLLLGTWAVKLPALLRVVGAPCRATEAGATQPEGARERVRRARPMPG